MIPNLSFGLKDGQLVHISTICSGLKCGCVCPACNHPLIARKGNKMIHHFAHYKSIECYGAVQTAIHLAAKEILHKSGKIWLPALTCSIAEEEGDSIILYKSRKLVFDKVYLEKRIDKIIPDILLFKKSRPLIIEISVTHPLDFNKIQKIKSLNISALEIDLSGEGPEITLENLKKWLIYGLKNKKWVFNVKRLVFHNQVQQYSKKLRVYYRKVFGCPLHLQQDGATSVDFIEDCFNCEYFIHANGTRSINLHYIKCVGHARKEIGLLISK